MSMVRAICRVRQLFLATATEPSSKLTVVWDFARWLVDQMQLEIHFEHTKPSNTMANFHAWWTKLEAAGLRAFQSELNMPSIHWLPCESVDTASFVRTKNTLFAYNVPP